MIRVIMPTGYQVVYPDADEATPVVDKGYSSISIHSGFKQYASIHGPCIIDDGSGLELIREAPNQERTCRVCGCTDTDCSQCIEKTGEACHWAEDDLCSACVPSAIETDARRSKNSPTHKKLKDLLKPKKKKS